jgi:hypothetical protein
MRHQQELELTGRIDESKPTVSTDFEGHGVLIVAKDTVKDHMPLCLGLGPSRNKARLVPCFEDFVPATLVEGWETGAVVEHEVLPNNRWNIGPCSSDGGLQRVHSTAELNMTAGNFSPTGPRCMITQADGVRAGRCLDGDSGIQPLPGGAAQVYPCAKRWHQFFSFGGNVEHDGNGEALPPKNAIHTSIPRHMVRRLRDHAGYPKQDYYICLGVRGRGDKDEDGWAVDEMSLDDGEDLVPEGIVPGEMPSVREWAGMQLVSTQCTNKDAVIEWVHIPFIVEEEEPQNTEADVDTDTEEENEAPQAEL